MIAALQADDESPWVSERSPLTPHRLARLLHPFSISSKQLRVGPKSQKGYLREAFADSWERYLPASPSPAHPKHRNTDHERSFCVSDGTPSDEAVAPGLWDLPVEVDYPRSAWDPDAEGEDPPRAAEAVRANPSRLGGSS